jgi:hypothetical protein
VKLTKSKLKQLVKEEARSFNKDIIRLGKSASLPRSLMNEIIKEEMSCFLFESKERLLREVEEEADETLQDASRDLEKADQQIGSVFKDPTKASGALFKTLEEFTGMNPDLWYDEEGVMKEEVRTKLQDVFGDMDQMGKEMRNIVRSRKPVEQRIEKISSVSKYGTGGSILAGFYQLFTNTKLPSLKMISQDLPMGLGDISIPVGITPGEVGGLIFFKAALVLAAIWFISKVLAILIKGGRSTYESLRDATGIGAKIMAGAVSAGKMFIDGIKSFVSWAWKKVKDVVDSKAQPEDIKSIQSRARRPSGRPSPRTMAHPEIKENLKTIRELKEILNFVSFYNTQKQLNA